MIEALSEAEGIDLDAPFDNLDGRSRRIILHGAGESWYNAPVPARKILRNGPRVARPAAFSFQYKGLFPALEEAGRVSFVYRFKLQGMVDEVPCAGCMGGRLRDDAAAVRFKGFTLDQISRWPLGEALAFFKKLDLGADEQHIAGDLLREVRDRLTFLVDVGLDYLSLARGTPTLSGGESQRIRLASQIGSGLTGRSLCARRADNRLAPSRQHTIAWAHSSTCETSAIHSSSSSTTVKSSRLPITWLISVRAREKGVEKSRRLRTTLQGESLNQVIDWRLSEWTIGDTGTGIAPAVGARAAIAAAIIIKGARQHNLRNLDVRFPLGAVTAVTGVSGSGKSSLVEDILWKAAAKTLHRAQQTPGAHESIEGLELIDKVISVDQSPLGSTPNSTPATYAGAFDLIRELFAKLPEAKVRGYSARRFSFNSAGGRCEACDGAGQKRIEMHFLPDVWITCDACGGTRYTAETLAVTFHGKTIADVLNLSVAGALELFANVPRIRRILKTLDDVGLGYISLGQAAPTLSGGEAQRVKLAAELSRPDTGKTLYILDEPTTGLALR